MPARSMLLRGASHACRSFGEVVGSSALDLEQKALEAVRIISSLTSNGYTPACCNCAALIGRASSHAWSSQHAGEIKKNADDKEQQQQNAGPSMGSATAMNSWGLMQQLSTPMQARQRWYTSGVASATLPSQPNPSSLPDISPPPPKEPIPTAAAASPNGMPSTPSTAGAGTTAGVDIGQAHPANVNTETPPDFTPAQLSQAISASNLESLKMLVVIYQDSMETQHLLKALSQVATLERRTDSSAPEHKLIPDIMALLLAKVMQQLPALSPLDRTTVILQLGRLEFFPGQDAMEQLVNPLIGNLGKIRLLRHIVDLVWALSRLGYHHSALLAEVSDVVVPRVDMFQAKMISRMAWSYAKVQHVDWALFNSLARAAYSKLADFDPGNFSILMWAFMSNRHSDEVFFDHVADVASRKISAFGPRDIARMLLAFAHLKYFNDTFFQAAARQAITTMAAMEPRHLSNIAWSCSKRRFFDKDLFNAIADRACQTMPDLKPQNLSNLVWAFANVPRDAYYNPDAPTEAERLPRTVVELFNGAAMEAVRQINDFTPQNLSNTARSYASYGLDHPSLFDAIRMRAQGQLHDFNTQNLSDLAWSFARMGKKDAELLGAIATITTSSPLVLQQASPHTLADLAWAFAYSELYDKLLFSEIASTCRDRVPSMAPNLVADLLWSFGVVQHVDEELVQAMKEACLTKLEYLKRHPEYLGKVVWALAQLNHQDAALLQALKDSCPGIEDFLASQFAVQDHSTAEEQHETVALEKQ